MKQIQLTQNQVALVDDEDYEWLNQWNWQCDNGYAIRSQYPGKKKVRMHRLIMNASRGVQVDHIDCNTLNNQRSNLRLCSHGENAHNRRKQHSTSRYKGVTWHKRIKRWEARIRINNVPLYLGVFVNEQDAAKAYDAAAIRLHGEFARINFPNDIGQDLARRAA